MLTVTKAAERIGATRQMILEAIKSGQLPVKHGYSPRIASSDLETFQRAQRAPGA